MSAPTAVRQIDKRLGQLLKLRRDLCSQIGQLIAEVADIDVEADELLDDRNALLLDDGR